MAGDERPKAVPTAFTMFHADMEATIKRTDSGTWQVTLPVPGGVKPFIYGEKLTFHAMTQHRAEERAVALIDQLAGLDRESKELSQRIHDAVRWQLETTD